MHLSNILLYFYTHCHDNYSVLVVVVVVATRLTNLFNMHLDKEVNPGY